MGSLTYQQPLLLYALISPRARLPYPRGALVLSSSPTRHGFPISFRITQKDKSDRSTVLLSDVLFGQNRPDRGRVDLHIGHLQTEPRGEVVYECERGELEQIDCNGPDAKSLSLQVSGHPFRSPPETRSEPHYTLFWLSEENEAAGI